MNARRAPPAPPESGSFAPTRWSLVQAAARTDDPQAREALSHLCRLYWFPLYSFVRRRTADPHAAQDLTQEFFLQLLEKQAVTAACPARGRFRAFLLAALQNFLVNEWEKGQAQKRGGGRPVLSLDFECGESRYALEPVDNLTPERLFDRHWALALLDRALEMLQAEQRAAGKERQFELLRPLLVGVEASHAVAAAELGLTEGAVRQAASRLRKRYRELLRAEVAQTVADPAEAEAELRELLACLSE